MAAEARKAGKAGFNAKEYSSGSMFPDADSAFSGKPQRGGARPVASGLRKTQPAAAGGPRGAFVPPFAKKAMAAGDGAQEDGPPRSKSLEALAGRHCSKAISTTRSAVYQAKRRSYGNCTIFCSNGSRK